MGINFTDKEQPPKRHTILARPCPEAMYGVCLCVRARACACVRACVRASVFVVGAGPHTTT